MENLFHLHQFNMKVFIPLLTLVLCFGCDERNNDREPQIKENLTQNRLELLGDTLLLRADYSECGEFGGHTEQIKLYQEGDGIKGVIIVDSVNCEFEPSGLLRHFGKDSAFIILNESDHNAVLNYLSELTKLTFDDKSGFDNSFNTFSARILKKDSFPALIHYESVGYDSQMNWNHFETLKKELRN